MAAIGLRGCPYADRGHRPLLQRSLVIPAQAGIQVAQNWIPACAGMTTDCFFRKLSEFRPHRARRLHHMQQ